MSSARWRSARRPHSPANAFLYGLGALGGEGADYVIELFKEEVRDTMRQVGINSIAQARSIELRHPGVWRF